MIAPLHLIEPKETRAAKQRAYYLANKDHINAVSRAYYRAHREQILAQSRAYAKARREQLAGYHKKYHKENKEKHNDRTRRGLIRKNYGISLEEYTAILAAQGGVCLICKVPIQPPNTRCKTGARACLDHCHDTGRIRGFLCHKCNLGIGMFYDRPELVLAAYEYLLSADEGKNEAVAI